jgi:hypothetical protein
VDAEAQVVERDEVVVLFRRAAKDEVGAIRTAWAELEEAVGLLRGRKFYGSYDPRTDEYRACVEKHGDDSAEALGLEPGVLPGGRFARVRLRGEPPAIYDLIGPTMQRLATGRDDADPSRPSLEFYRRFDEIDLLLPVR